MRVTSEQVRPGATIGGVAGRRGRPVVWWAAFGIAAVVMQGYVYLSWILSPDFRPVGTGADEVPQAEKVWAWILQPTFCAAALLAVVYVARECMRERRLTFDGKVFLACLSLLWLDTIGNYVSPQIMFSSYYLNMGSWVEHIPGWKSYHGANIPQNLIELSVYTAMIFVVIAACRLMSWMRRTWPGIGNAGLILWTWTAMALFIIVLEWPLLILTGFAVWAGAVPGLTMLPGSRHQMPLAPDPIIWGAALTAISTLRFFRDDSGRSLVEKGIERVRGGRFQAAASTFAIIGWANFAMLVYGLLWAGLAIFLGPTPEGLPSYIRNDLCGPGTPQPCPAPDVPIPLLGPDR